MKEACDLQIQSFLRRCWAEIDLGALKSNLDAVVGALPPATDIMAVLKADAYGHGAVRVADALSDRCRWFALSNLCEALELRRAGFSQDILVLGFTPPELAPMLAEHRIAQTVFSLSYARQLSDNTDGRTVGVHFKIDTGMGRLGFSCLTPGELEAARAEIAAACLLPGLQPDGIYTHFAESDADDSSYTLEQFSNFAALTDALAAGGISFRFRHVSNSGAVVNYPQLSLDLVRPGILLYGCYPSPDMTRDIGLKPVMSLRTVVSQIREIPAGRSISYGRSYVTPTGIRAAAVALGYADGFPRALSGRASLLVGGCAAPILGRICMDQCMIDVSRAGPLREGETVTVFGHDGGAFQSVDTLAEQAGTIPYELLCTVGKRVPRVYLEGERVVEVCGSPL